MEMQSWIPITPQKDILISDASFLALEASIRQVNAKIWSLTPRVDLVATRGFYFWKAPGTIPGLLFFVIVKKNWNQESHHSSCNN